METIKKEAQIWFSMLLMLLIWIGILSVTGTPLSINLPGEHVLRRDVADGAVQRNVVVMLYVTLHQTPCIFERQRRPGAECTPL
jgi:hypothetical protein